MLKGLLQRFCFKNIPKLDFVTIYHAFLDPFKLVCFSARIDEL